MKDALIFKAMADESRRKLLDSLFLLDGQTLSQLETKLPNMTRFGVMKHLKILEEAGLVITKKRGREKNHYLNPAPIGELYDRWVGKYAQPHLRILSGIKSSLETITMTQPKTTTHIIQSYIRATKHAVWQALIDPEMTSQYFFDSRLQSDLKVGSPFRYVNVEGETMIDGVVVECDPPNRLVSTFIQMWEGEPLEGGLVTYELIEMGDMTKIRLTHEGLPEGHPIVDQTFSGWSYILAGLKTLLETGERLEPAGS